MPPPRKNRPTDTLEQIAADIGLYPVQAYEFVLQGLGSTVEKIHGETPPEKEPPIRHISGQELCLGLRDYALKQWGMLARTVLQRWNLTETLDFGTIVFGLVQRHILRTSENDSLEDFRDVYDFKSAFEVAYRIESAV